MNDESDANNDYENDDVEIENPRQTERKRARLEREADEENEFWRQALATKVGRRAFYKMFQQGGLWSTPFAVGPNGFPQPEATWFKAGEQAVIARIHDKFQLLDHGAVFTMLRENDPRFRKVRS